MRLQEIKNGATTEQVIKVFGQPQLRVKRISNRGDEVWVYDCFEAHVYIYFSEQGTVVQTSFAWDSNELEEYGSKSARHH